MTEKSIYIHTENIHNLDDPNEILPIIYKIFEPKSVIDIGCGIGTFLFVSKKLGIKRVLGLDGQWTDRRLSSKYLSDEEFIEADLSKPILLKENFDLALCLEVAEHLPESSADSLVSSLARLSKIIIFSAAVPGQGGQNHINEQEPGYWQEKFKKHGLVFFDIFRDSLWYNRKVHWWYKQNIFLVTNEEIFECHKNKIVDLPLNPTKIDLLIHPELFKLKVAEIKALSTRKGFCSIIDKIKKRF